ncbi:peptidoglycan-binding protein [Gracilibacillus sp. HCP3S3_G5_1]|uniref:peptidoglycan-binding protein n=1 Tax=unclassified Gracilibacillus TaxID=2625209 RepID=UPI003F89A085
MRLKVCILFFLFNILSFFFYISDSLATTEVSSNAEAFEINENEVMEEEHSSKQNNEAQQVQQDKEIEEVEESSVNIQTTQSLEKEQNKTESDELKRPNIDQSNIKEEKNDDTLSQKDENLKQQVTTSSVESQYFQNGTYDDGVIELKLNLAKAGFKVSDNPTDHFGPITEKVVKEFQLYYGLTVTGIADDQTLEKLDSIINNPLQNGNRNDETIELKHNLATLGFVVPGNMTEHYGDLTEATVKEFQEAYGLVPSGIADEVTLRKINELLEAPLSNGMYREDVIELKINLAKVGFKVSNNPTNHFGPLTEAAVKQFQEYYDLAVTGVADETTLRKLDEILNSPLQNGNRNDETKELKHNLATLGFIVPGNMTDLYGDQTEATVKRFQEAYGLVPSGIADEVTLRKISELLEAPLSNGMYREDVIELKINLAKVGFKVSNNPTNHFGPLTEATVKQFQEYYELTVTGVADETTLKKLDEILSSPLQNGNRNNETRELKHNLATLGFVVPGNMTELYGDQTEATVKEFQEAYGLVPSGIADEVTLRKISELLEAPLSNGMYREDVIELKINLAKVGFKVSNNPTNHFGPLTEAAVKQFQEYYDLAVTGVADETTLRKLDEILNSPLQNGNRNDETKELKHNLATLGFIVPGNMTDHYGPQTEKTVKEFQAYYGLKSNGIADERTLNKIEEVLSSPLQNGNYNEKTIQLKHDLKSLGFVVSGNMTDHYGPKTEQTVKDFQRHYGLKQNGIADTPTLNKIKEILSSPMQNGNYNSRTVQLKYDLAALGFVVPGNMTEHYGPKTEEAVKSFQKAYGLPVSGIADEITLQTIETALRTMEDNLVTIFIDPGHGGTDPGAIGYGINEKDVVLDIAKKASDYLTKNYLGVRTVLSRESDIYVSLDDRTRHANSIGADYFVSIHNNAFNGSASGFETYIYNGSSSATTKNNQKIIHNYLIDQLNVNDRGMKEANFHVLRTSNMPSILIEFLFIDNKAENEKLRDSSYREWLGQITAEAIAKAYGLKKK